MYNDPYNPELNPGKDPELVGEDSKEIAPGWEDVAAEADSPDAPSAIGSPESYRSPNSPRRGTIGEDLDTLRKYLDDEHEEGAAPPNESDITDDADSSEDAQDESPNDITEELSESEIESRFRDYIRSLESEFGNVRNMSNDGLRRQIHEEKQSLEYQLSNPDASADRTLYIDLAVRKRAEAILGNDDELEARA